MSTVFTTISDGLDWQAKSFIEELVKGLSERAQAIGGSSRSISAGDDIQAVTFWSGLQDDLETICVEYIDHTIDFSASTGFTAFDIDTWRAEAGIHADGFRRATTWPTDWEDLDDPAYSYGTIQAGDIIGPWLFQDLQNGLSALKWSSAYASPGVTDSAYWYAIGEDSDTYDCETARAAQIAAWSANTWASAASNYISGGYGFSSSMGGTAKTFWAYRYRGKAIISSVYTGRPVAVDWYGVSSMPTGTFSDFDSLGLVNNEYFLIESDGEASTSTRTSTLQGDYSTNPIEVIPMNCPIGANSIYGYYISFGLALLKWNFTNA
jgi:hypothetical protein